MFFSTAAVLVTSLIVSVSAKDSRTFAVNHFYGQGPLVSGRMDPIVSPGQASGHVHTIQGGSNFALTMSDTTLLDSSCTSSLVKNDKSNYWTPSLYFQDPKNGSFTSVPMFYMNVYYFFEATDDEIVAFQPGHRMVVGSPELRTPPATGGESITDLNYGVPQPVQWTCPRSNYDVPSYPANSDGLHGVGIQDPGNKGAGVGFPDENCDGYASPLRADIHFPSCYNPAAGLDDYKNNMQFPSSAGASAGKANCPQGWIHTPHLFYEVYWNTPLFVDMWTQGQGSQPFVLSNGDPTGYSLHADFISGWDVTTLQQIIDNCDAGDSGMDKCPGLIGGLNDPSTSCNIPSAIQETITGELEALPGNNPVTGWGTNVVAPAAGSSSISAASSPSASAVSAAGSAPASAIYPVSSAPASAVYPVSSTPASISPVASSAPIPVSTTGYSDSDSGYGDTGSGSESSSGSGSGTIETSVSSSSPATATNSPSTPSATGNGSAPAGWSYYGCYSDSLSERVLTGITFANLGNGKVTSTGCVAYCEAEGYSMAGTEYAGQCFCGNYLVGSTLQADSLCNMKCEGDPTQICGGSLTLSVYKKSNSMRRRHMHLNKHLAAALKV